jgi:predicted esterase
LPQKFAHYLQLCFTNRFKESACFNNLRQGPDTAPAIILLHGLFGDKDNLGNLASRLAGTWCVIQVTCPTMRLPPAR